MKNIKNRVKELRVVRAADLLENPKNWRRHSRAQSDALRAVLARIGYAGAVLARELSDGRLMLLDGHLRVATTPDALMPVLILDVNESEADEILATYDPLGAMAEADAEQLKKLLETVRPDDAALEALLRQTAGERLWATLHPVELDEADVSPDKADELGRKWGTKPGQLWRAGPHCIICADCSDAAAVNRLWGDRGLLVRLIWTDPPWGAHYATKNRFLNKSDRGNRIQKPIANDHLSPEETGALFQQGLAASSRYCEPGACIYAIVPSGPLLVLFINALEAAGFAFKGLLVWVKNHFVIGMRDYHPRHEVILYGWRTNGAHLWNGGRSQDSVFEIDRPAVSDLHPTTKPLALIAKMIANSSRPGELVYEPYAGSGSTLLAAHQLGRIAYGCEIDPGYVAVTLERLALLGLKPELVK